MTSALAWTAAAVLAVIGIIEVVRRLPPQVGLALFLGLPLLATPLWLRDADAPIFSVVKVYSVCAGAAYMEALKLTRWTDHRWARLLAYLLLALNILEAVVADLVGASAINAVAGAILVLTQAYPDAITVERDTPRRDLRYPLGGWWVAAYTLWNFAFVHGHAPTFTAFAAVHLSAPILACRGRADLWLQARVIGLAALMMLRMSAPRPPYLHLVQGWRSPAAASALHAASLALAIFVAWRSLREGRRTGARRSLLDSVVGD